MDTAYQNAMAVRDRLKQQLDEVETFLRLYNRFSAKTDAEQSELAKPEPKATSQTQMPAKSSRRVKPSELVEIIARILNESVSPLQRGDIVQALEDRDVELESQDPPRYVGTILWRNSDKFVNIPNEGYVLASNLTAEQQRKIDEGNLNIPEETKDLLGMVASEYSQEVSPDQKKDVIALWDVSERFPSDLDGKLLVMARTVLDRELTPPERRFLRLRAVENFRQHGN